MRRAGVVGAVLCVLAVSGCTGPDLTAVPTAAAAPFVCAGVPRTGVELLLGGRGTVATDTGSWGGAVGAGLTCIVEHGDSNVMVIDQPVSTASWGPTEQDVLDALSRESDSVRLDLDGPGSGYVVGDYTVGWVCGGRYLSIEAPDVDVDGRDRGADLTNLLTSMLPWACEGEDVPPASEQEE